MKPADIEKLVESLGAGGKVLENYILPGMISTELARPAIGGLIRLFHMTREQEYEITPHDHRFGFKCAVLDGCVTNRVYKVDTCHKDHATHVTVPYDPSTHSLNEALAKHARANFHEATYNSGDWYQMEHEQFHAIRFSRGARVLFIEGPEEKSEGSCLLPYINGRICNTFLWRDWMMTEVVRG